MKAKNWSMIGMAWVLGLIGAGGCSEPKAIVPVAPPGMQLSRTLDIPEGEGPQAIGEAAVNPSATTSAKIPDFNSPPTALGETRKTSSGLQYSTLAEGKGDAAKSGQNVTVHYVGTLENGNKFDSSRDKGQPFTFQIGGAQVIPGWDEGVAGMKIGERRKLIVPPALGYGVNGKGPIPPNATLIFEVELLGAK